ncbi:MAG: dehydrogenase [Streptosporangiales bacterium]|nr:dehydrogenase [Streptosporangiales bacterium]
MKLGLAGAGRIGSMHAATLAALPGVDALVIADADTARAQQLADRLGSTVHATPRVDDLFERGMDGLVVAAATDVHAELVLRAVDAQIPVFCEKPVAVDVAGTREVVDVVERAGALVQVGFQRRFDPGHVAARAAVRAGDLGFVHTIRSTTLDPAPPQPEYVAASGGLFRDCGVHDFDAIRWVTGREIVEVYASGANRGASYFRDYGDVDTGAAMITLDDDTIALFSGTRYNAAGYDVRMELLGERGSVVVGLDDTVPLRSAESGVGWPAGPASPHFAVRFERAYLAEVTAFTELLTRGVGDGVPDGVCTPREALEAFYVAEACELSKAERRPVQVAEVRR